MLKQDALARGALTRICHRLTCSWHETLRTDHAWQIILQTAPQSGATPEETPMSNTTRTSARAGVFSTLGALAAGFAIMIAPGCSDEDPCQDYVDYICACDDPSCESQRNAYADADSKLQDQCENDLQDLKDADKAAGEECASYGDTGA